jgi:predicted DNA-binding transcriptional regulator YafY
MKLDRLLGILTTLMQKERVTAPYLAEKFEVTRRTIGRDLDTLAMAGIPIVTRQGGGGGISIAPGYRLDKTILTTEELGSILAALRGIGTVTGQAGLERMLDKLGVDEGGVVSLAEPVVIDFGNHHKNSLAPKIERLKTAIRDRRIVSFDYYYEKGVSVRRIEPMVVLFHWTAWYVLGYCLTRQDFRLFKLDRLWELTLCEETFAPREIPPEKRDLDLCFPDDQTLVALFHPSTRYQLIETYGLHSFTETADGKLRLEVGYTSHSFILSWLLGFGNQVRVLEPASLAQEIRDIAKKMLSDVF